VSAQAPRADERPLAVPRRWSDTLDGIAWLPRLIDKARMSQSGSLGTYLFGHSPFDAALLGRLGTSTDEFAAIVDGATSDDDVLAKLRARGFDEAGVRRWSQRLPRLARFYTYLWDVDDGYVRPRAGGAVVLALWRAIERPVIAILRVVFKRP
jgi:hypothetical protein